MLIALMLTAGVIIGAIIAETVVRRQIHLDNGTVWIASRTERRAARLNVRAAQIEATIDADDVGFDVLQHDDATLLTAGSSLIDVDAATLTVTDVPSLPPSAKVMLSGAVIAVLDESTGEVWTCDADDPTALSGVAKGGIPPRTTLGEGGRLAVDHRGTVYAYRPADGTVLAFDGSESTPMRELASLSGGSRLDADALTVVDGVPVVVSGDTVTWPSGSVRLDVTSAMPQLPPVDGEQSGWVALAGEGTLTVVDLAEAKTVVHATGGDGAAAVPVSVGGCVHAAWAQTADNYVSMCGAGDATGPFSTLNGLSATAVPTFRVNHRLVVLNDIVDGAAWQPDAGGDAFDLTWEGPRTERMDDDSSAERSTGTRPEFHASCSQQSGRIVAVDDELDVRAGATRTLDVLRNDEQTNCSTLRIVRVGAASGPAVTIDTVRQGRLLQLDATVAEPGTAVFTYEIDDGRGRSSSATVTLRIHERLSDAGANAAPELREPPGEHDVEQGAAVTINALDGFRDPEGDPLMLTGASVRNTAQATVSTRADGRLVFHAGSAPVGRAIVDVTVSDGSAETAGTLHVSVYPPGTLPAGIDPASASARPDETVTVRLDDVVHATGSHAPRLAAVDAPDGMDVSVNGTGLAFECRTHEPGTHYVSYTVMQGELESTGIVRVDVEADARRERPPVTVDDTALLDGALTATAEPLRNDIDPMGGVLAVVSAQAHDDGVEATVRDHRVIVITASKAIERPATVTYTAANGIGSATGSIVVHPASPQRSSTLVAYDATASVRTGGIVSVDVRDHVIATHGCAIRLVSGEPASPAAFRGFAFVSGSAVRYQAPDEAGTFPVTYTVTDALGGTASGTIVFNVHASDGETKPPPSPQDVDAQVAAGRTTRIDVPLTGIDADGDDVMLSGLGNTAPTLGRIVGTDANGFLYEAYRDSSGTDEFTYAVEDWTGQRAQATIRVGVLQTDGTDAGVHALDDAVTLRPGAHAAVEVTANDIAPGGTRLTVDVEPDARGVVDVTADGGTIRFTAVEPGTAYIVHTVRNDAGVGDIAVLTVTVDPQAPIEPPKARDGRVAPEDTVDKRSVTVDVSPWASTPSGDDGGLTVSVHESASAFARAANELGPMTVAVTLADRPLAVPYTVTDVASGLSATAFVHVPAYGVFPPTLRPKAPRLEADGRETLLIRIADHVRVGPGKVAAIASPESVSATRSDGSDAYVDAHTLRFRAAEGYSGPASITFTVTDGIATPADGTSTTAGGTDSPQTPAAPRIVNTATLTLPITVVGDAPSAPEFSSGVIDVVAGEAAQTISLAELTRAPQDSTQAATPYVYASEGLDGPVSATILADGRMTVSARRDAPAGTLVSVPFTIDYGAGTLDAGVMVRVVPSARPLARIAPADVQAAAGQTLTIDIAEHSYNPFPDVPLAIVDASSDDATLQVGHTGSGTLTVIVPANARALTASVTVTVADGTLDPSRQVTGTFTVTVSDRPEAPLLMPADEGMADGTVTLQIVPGSPNGSPVMEYRIDYEGGGRSCSMSTICTLDGLVNGRTYVFTASARNAVGWSDPSNAVEARPDRPPAAVGVVEAIAGSESLQVSWRPPDYAGTPPDRYTVTVNGSNGLALTTATPDTTARFAIPRASITDGTRFTATVRAHNVAGDGPESAPSAPASPWASPDPPAVTLTQQPGDRTIRVTVTLGDMRNAGCSAITLSGALERRLPCPQGSGGAGGRRVTDDFSIGEDDVGRRLTVTATVSPLAATGAATGSATLTPVSEIDAPANVRVSGSGDRCTVQWTRRGRADSFEVHAEGLGTRVVGAGDDAVTFTLEPWQRCGRATVRQGVGGMWGATAEGAGRYVYKTPAVVDERMTLSWHPDDRNVITVSHGTVQTHGQPVRQYALSVNGVTVPWRPGTTTVRLDDTFPYSTRYVWRLTVSGDDPELDVSTSGVAVTGLRATGSSQRPGTSPFPHAPGVRSPFLGLAPASPFHASARDAAPAPHPPSLSASRSVIRTASKEAHHVGR